MEAMAEVINSFWATQAAGNGRILKCRLENILKNKGHEYFSCEIDPECWFFWKFNFTDVIYFSYRGSR